MAHEITFYFLAAVTLAGAMAAMSLRNLVHAALCAAVAFGGLAAIYLLLDAEFVGFAQFLVYVGAIAILIVFTILLTHGVEIKSGAPRFSTSWLTSLATVGLVAAGIILPVLHSPGLRRLPEAKISAPVKQIGHELISGCVVPLETIGLLLTAALLGAVVIAMSDKAPAPRKIIAPKPARKVREEVGVP